MMRLETEDVYMKPEVIRAYVCVCVCAGDDGVFLVAPRAHYIYIYIYLRRANWYAEYSWSN